MIYAMSDIHGCMDELEKQMEYIELEGDNRMVFLGDYIDYGRKSCQVLEFIKALQDEYGKEKVVVLKGNHEEMLLEWIADFTGSYRPELEALAYDSWLKTDSEHRFNTFRTFVPEEVFAEFEEYCRKASFVEMNQKAVQILKERHSGLIKWIKDMPSFYETDTQIFVHAGVDEEAGEYWKWGSSDEVFLWRFPAVFGKFLKIVVAGHVGTGSIAHDRYFHDVYFDGQSHYYIDGSVYKHGKLLLLVYDDNDKCYYQMDSGRKNKVRKFERYR